MTQARPSAMEEWRTNWLLLVAAMAGISFAAIPTATLGLFMQPLQDEFGWSRTTISLGLTIFALTTTPLSPFAGALVDKVGPRALAVPGVALAGLAFAAFSLLNASVAMWVAVWIAYSLAALLIRSTVWNKIVSSAFVTSRGLAIALLLSGLSVAGAIAPIITHGLMSGFGWRGAYLGLGLGWAGLAWILVILFFREPRSPRTTASGAAAADSRPIAAPGGLSGKEAMRNQAIVRLAIAVLLSTMMSAAFSVHAVPIHISLGASRGEAAGIVAFVGIGAMIGKILAGWIADRVNSSFLPFAAFAMPTVGYLLLLAGKDSLPILSAATFFIGMGSGAAVHMTMYLTTQYGGLRSFGTIYGSIAALMGLAAGVGPLAAGLVHDATEAYTLFIMTAIPVVLLTGLLVFGLGPYPDFRPEPQPQPEAA